MFFSITGDLDKPNGNDKVVITVTPVLLTMTRPVTAQELEWGTTRPQTVSIVEYHDAVHGQVVTIEAQFKALDARDRIEESVRLMLQRTFGITWAGLAAGF